MRSAARAVTPLLLSCNSSDPLHVGVHTAVMALAFLLGAQGLVLSPQPFFASPAAVVTPSRGFARMAAGAPPWPLGPWSRLLLLLL
eukprot:scaffold111622_cov33-Tisochrysis_lutea.AAC.1